jgi:hypothetical protein
LLDITREQKHCLPARQPEDNRRIIQPLSMSTIQSTTRGTSRIQHPNSTASERNLLIRLGDDPGRGLTAGQDLFQSPGELGLTHHPIRPELPDVKLVDNIGQAPHVVLLRMRGHHNI